MAQESHVSFKLNIPISLKNRLSEAAERSGRSLTAEIIIRLQASLSLADDNNMDFTPEAFEALIIDIVGNSTADLEARIKALEDIAAGRDPYNRAD